MHNSTLSFAGGTGSVTGANFLLKTGALTILVDCGLTQGGAFCDDTNYAPFPYNPQDVDILIVTHAHMDHIGRIPKLVQDGFSGVIHSTAATKDLAEVMFQDAVRILRDEAVTCGREPLYDAVSVEKALARWHTHDYHEKITLPDSIEMTFKDAGHILGSGMVFLERAGKTLVFTGDLGNSPDVLLNDTESLAGANYVVMESVYGDRAHEHREERRAVLESAIRDTVRRKGTLLIPSFSLQRTQVLLSEINDLFEERKFPALPVFLDSPLAIKVLDIYDRYKELYNSRTQERYARGDDPFAFDSLTLTPRTEDAGVIETAPAPKIIIAGSGMSHGGRIRNHEKRYLGDKNALVLFVGYQTVGSLGRRIKDGAKKVRIDTEWVSVRALVRSLDGYSAHRDLNGLMDFVAGGKDTLQKVFVAMGEPKAALFLTQRLRDFLSVDAYAPQQGETHTLSW